MQSRSAGCLLQQNHGRVSVAFLITGITGLIVGSQSIAQHELPHPKTN